jgi:signal transduction histidine kinase
MCPSCIFYRNFKSWDRVFPSKISWLGSMMAISFLLVSVFFAGAKTNDQQSMVPSSDTTGMVGASNSLPKWSEVPLDSASFDKFLDDLKEQGKLERDVIHRYYREGYEYFLQKKNQYAQAELLWRLGNYYLSQSMLTSAEDAFTESLEMFKVIKSPFKVAHVTMALGTVKGRMGAYDQATENFMEALKTFEELQDQPGIANVHLKLGTVYTYLSDYERALKHSEKALEIALVHDKVNVITLYGNIAFIYMDLGEFDKSEEYFKLAIEYPVVPTNPKPRALAYLNLGQLYKLQGKQVLANRYFDQAEKLAKEWNLVEELMALTIVRVDESSPQAIAKSIDKLIDLKNHAKEFGLNYMQFEVLKKLVELGKSLNWHEKTIEWMEEKNVVEDQMWNERKEKDIATLRTTYEIEKSKQEIEDLDEEVKVQKRMNTLILVFSVIFVVGFIVLIYFYFRSKKANRLLAERESALKNTLLVKDKLFSIIGHDLKNAIGSQPIVLELLRDTIGNKEESEKLIDGLEASIHNVLYVFDTLLHWGKMQFKGVSVRSVEFEVYPLVENSIRLLKLNAELKDLKIVNEITPTIRLYADQDHFKFIMRNLVSNAIKYSRKGGEIRVGVHEILEDKVVFFVSDQGVGMDEHEVATLFDADRSSTPGTDEETGNGIALMLSKEFVLKNGGEIWVESTKGKGATLYFSMNSIWNKK